MSSFRALPHSLRTERARKLLSCYPDRVPVIIEPQAGCHLPSLTKQKYVVPRNHTVAQLCYFVRSKMEKQGVTADQSVFLVGRKFPRATDTIGQLYEDEKDTDNFLYLRYASEDTFG